MKQLLVFVVACTICGAAPMIVLAQAPAVISPAGVSAAVVPGDLGPALAREGDRVIFRRADGARVAVSYGALTDADRTRVDAELAKTAGTGQAKIPPAADALVRIDQAKAGGEFQSAGGIVFHAHGERAFIYVAGSLGGEPPFGELSAVVPGRDPEKRIPVQYLTAFGFGFGQSSRGLVVLAGPRAELPEPIRSDPPYAVPTAGQALTIVADVRPPVPGKSSKRERIVLPATIGPETPDPNLPRTVARTVVRCAAMPSVQNGLVFDEAGNAIGMVGWGGDRVNPAGEREFPWTSTAFFASLRQGPVIGGANTAIDGPDGKPQLKIDFALGTLGEAPEPIVIKAVVLPADQDAGDAAGAILAAIDAAPPPPMIELGELKPATEAEMGKLRGPNRGYKPENMAIEYRSLTVAAPQPYLDGNGLLLIGFERDAAGKERRRIGLVDKAVPKAYEETQRALQERRYQAATAAAAAQPPFSGNPRPVDVSSGAPRYDVNKPPKFLAPIPAAELK